MTRGYIITAFFNLRTLKIYLQTTAVRLEVPHLVPRVFPIVNSVSIFDCRDNLPINFIYINMGNSGAKIPHYWYQVVDTEIPSDVFDAHYQTMNGYKLYVGRGWHANRLIPGHVFPKVDLCTIIVDGEKRSTLDYEILCGNALHWVQINSGQTPPDTAVIGGTDAENNPMFIGRIVRDGYADIGRVEKNVCYIFRYCYDGENLYDWDGLNYAGEHSYTDYEVLVES